MDPLCLRSGSSRLAFSSEPDDGTAHEPRRRLRPCGPGVADEASVNSRNGAANQPTKIGWTTQTFGYNGSNSLSVSFLIVDSDFVSKLIAISAGKGRWSNAQCTPTGCNMSMVQAVEPSKRPGSRKRSPFGSARVGSSKRVRSVG